MFSADAEMICERGEYCIADKDQNGDRKAVVEGHAAQNAGVLPAQPVPLLSKADMGRSIDILHADLLQDLVHEGAGKALAGMDPGQLPLLFQLDGGGGFGQFPGILRLDDQDAVAIAHQDVARADDLSAHADREVDLAGAVLIRELKSWLRRNERAL